MYHKPTIEACIKAIEKAIEAGGIVYPRDAVDALRALPTLAWSKEPQGDGRYLYESKSGVVIAVSVACSWVTEIDAHAETLSGRWLRLDGPTGLLAGVE